MLLHVLGVKPEEVFLFGIPVKLIMLTLIVINRKPLIYVYIQDSVLHLKADKTLLHLQIQNKTTKKIAKSGHSKNCKMRHASILFGNIKNIHVSHHKNGMN